MHYSEIDSATPREQCYIWTRTSPTWDTGIRAYTLADSRCERCGSFQVLHSVDESVPASAQVIEQWELQFDGIPPTRHPRNFSYDDEPTKIYKRMVRQLPWHAVVHMLLGRCGLPDAVPLCDIQLHGKLSDA